MDQNQTTQPPPGKTAKRGKNKKTVSISLVKLQEKKKWLVGKPSFARTNKPELNCHFHFLKKAVITKDALKGFVFLTLKMRF